MARRGLLDGPNCRSTTDANFHRSMVGHPAIPGEIP